MNFGRREMWVCGLLVAVGCLVWLWPVTAQIGSAPFWPGAEYSDLLVSHYPNAVMIHTGIKQYHQVPLWNPTILSGTPANADPLVGMWYPPRWFSFLFPSIWIFNLLVWGHFVLAGVGAYRLARLEGASKKSALLAGIVLVGMPKLAAHLALGHIDLLLAISWTPWVLIALHDFLRRLDGSQTMLVPAAKLGLAVGVVFLADPRWMIPVVLLLIVYAVPTIWRLIQEDRSKAAVLKKLGGSMFLSVLTAALAAAPLALPLIQYTALSTRRTLTTGDQELYSLPILRITGLAFPFNDVPEWVTYLGLALLILFMVGVALRSKAARRWGVISILFLLLAFGSATPVYSVLATIPGFGLLRVPARYLVMVGIAVSIGGAHALDALMSRSQSSILDKRLNLASVAVIVAAIGTESLFFSGQENSWVSLLQVGISGLGALALILARDRLRRAKTLYPLLWLSLISLDFLWMNSTILEVRQLNQQSEPAWLEEIDSNRWGQWRTFSPSYSLGQDQAAQNQIEMVDGVHPLQLSSYYEYAAQATGFDPDPYSVTLPPFPDGDPSIAWDVHLDSQALGKLSVRFVISAYPLSDQGLVLISDRDVFVYENEDYRPRAWVESAETPGEWSQVAELEWSPNRIHVQAEGPGRLVLSEMDYPGWTATLNGDPAEIIPYDGLLRSIDLEDGVNQVALVYQPLLTWIGLGGWAVLILSLLVLRLKWWT